MASVFTVGRAFLTAVYTDLVDAGREVRLSEASTQDLAWWATALDKLPDQAAMRKAPSPWDMAMITDASLSGQGIALFQTLKAALKSDLTGLRDAAYGPVLPRGVPGDMTWLESVAVLSAVSQWGPLFKGSTGYIVVDNEPLEWAWKKGRSKSARVNEVLRVILLKLLELDAQIFPVRVQSKDNIVADVLSRRFEPGGSPFPQWLSRCCPRRLPLVTRVQGDPCPSWL